MKTITISAMRRSDVGKKNTRELRKTSHVPCVLYGGPEVIHFHAPVNDFRHIVYTPEAYIIELDVDGTMHKAVLQDMQFHPVNDDLLHMDFVEVFDEKPVTMEIPIRLVGAAIGIKNGGKSRQRRRSLKVRGLIQHLPDTLDIDVSNVEIGDVIKIGDLSFENMEILDPKRSMIYAIVSSRVSMKGMEITEPEAAEGLVTEGEETAAAEEATEAAEGEKDEG